MTPRQPNARAWRNSVPWPCVGISGDEVVQYIVEEAHDVLDKPFVLPIRDSGRGSGTRDSRRRYGLHPKRSSPWVG